MHARPSSPSEDADAPPRADAFAADLHASLREAQAARAPHDGQPSGRRGDTSVAHGDTSVAHGGKPGAHATTATAATAPVAAQPTRRPPAASSAAFTPETETCATHGSYPVNLRDAQGVLRYLPPGCPGCRKQQAAEKLLRRAAIAPRFAHCGFDNYEADTAPKQLALDKCRAYARDFARLRAQGACLILRGKPGTGKNHLACAIAKAVVAQGMSVLNATAHEIVQRIRETWGGHGGSSAHGGQSEAQVLREFAALDLLIIDEVGRQYRSRDGADSVELFNVIDARYRRVAPTIIISNGEREAIRDYLGHAAFDRLREGGGQLANFDWETYRK